MNDIPIRKVPHPEEEIRLANVLVDALPYIQAYRDKTVLIKFGGSAMDDPELVKSLMKDIVLMEALGLNPIVVHGGGKSISKVMRELGEEARFVNGLRVTSPKMIAVVEQTLSNEINPELVQIMRDAGGKAVGISGTNVFVGERIYEKGEGGSRIDLGMVGQVISSRLPPVNEALSLHITPVISPLARELGSDQSLNVNADLAAAALARELRPVKLIYISDVPGLMPDPSDPDTIFPSINRKQALELIEKGVISGGMIPKVRSAIDALNTGVRKVHFIDGRLRHSLLLEIFTEQGIGTEIVREQR